MYLVLRKKSLFGAATKQRIFLLGDSWREIVTISIGLVWLMLESLLTASVIEGGKEAIYAFLRGLQPSDFAKVGEELVNRLLRKYSRYEPVNEDRLLLFFERARVLNELDRFRDEYIPPDLEIIKTEFREEFATDFNARLLKDLAKDFAEEFQRFLIASLPENIGFVLARMEASDKENNAQHRRTHQVIDRIEARLVASESRQQGMSTTDIDSFSRTQVETSAEYETVSIRSHAPYLRTIEYQERDLQQYRTAFEDSIQRGIDESIELIQNHQLRQAQTRLENLCNQELVRIPNPDEITSELRANVYRLLGICQMRLGELETANSNFEIARSIEGETEKLQKTLLEYFVIKGDYQLASQLAHEMLANNPTLIEAKNTLAIILLNEKKFDDVVSFYKEEAHTDQDPTAQDILCVTYLQLNNLSKALEKAQRLVELEPNSPRAYESLGNAYLAKAIEPLQHQVDLQATWFQEIVDKNSLQQAITNFETALGLYNDSGQRALWVLRTNLASAYSINGRPKDALRLIDENIEQTPEPFTENFLLKAQFEDDLGNLDLAIETCQQALQFFQDDYKFMEIIGGLYLNKGELETSRDWLDRAEQHCNNPQELTQIKTLCLKTYLVANDQVEAWKCIQNACSTERDSIPILVMQGDYHFHFKNYSEAEECYTKALSETSDNLALLDRLIKFYVNFGHPEKAIGYAEQFIQLAPTAIAYRNYVELLITSNELLEAINILEYTKKQAWDFPFFLEQEARCRHLLGHILPAIELYEEYLKVEPDNLVATFNLGVCYHRQGKRAKAIQIFKGIEEYRPDDSLVHQALAQVYQIEGDLTKSYQHACQALELAPDDPNIYLFFFEIAYFCGHEEEATRVLQEVPTRFPEYEHLKIVGIEEAKELFASSKENYQYLKAFYQEGNLPLAFVAHWLHKPLPFIWQVFRDDEEIQILCALGTLEEQAQSYTTSSQATEVVVAYSSLCTLYHLGLLDLPLKLFDKVYLAQRVFDQIEKDILFLTGLAPPHRLERLEMVLNIISHTSKIQQQTEWQDSSLILDSKQAEDIRPFNEQDILLAKQHNALYLLDNKLIFASVEQILPNQVTPTKKLLDYFQQNGKIRQVDYDTACEHLRKIHSLHDFGTNNIAPFGSVVVDHLTLEILLETNTFQLLIDEFDSIFISHPTLILLNQQIGELKFYQHTLQIVKEIEAVAKDHYTQFSPIVEDPNKYPDREEHLGSALTQTFVVADQLSLPIWTDDLASRKLVASGEWGELNTFNTRTVLDLALARKVLTIDETFTSILALLRWNYHFTPINSAILFWSIHQRNFHFNNEDSDLFLAALDQSVVDAHKEYDTLFQRIQGSADLPQLEAKLELLINNERIYSDLIIHLWSYTPALSTRLRTQWTVLILAHAATAMSFSSFELKTLIALCVSRMLQEVEKTKLSGFLMLCTSPLTLEFLSEADVDKAVLFVFIRILYSEKMYKKHKLQMAAKLLDSLRKAQSSRIQYQLQNLTKTDNQFKDFFNAVQAERYSKTRR